MKNSIAFLCSFLVVITSACTNDDALKNDLIGTADVGSVDPDAVSCSEVDFGNWETSKYTLPYYPGETRRIGLSSCSGSFHSQGLPDQFAVDFEMEIGDFVLDEALARTRIWQEKFLPGFRIAVNLSPRQFRNPKLIENLQACIESSGLDINSLELEITEGVLMTGYTYIDDALNSLNELGVNIAMDDFGTGYSSLSYLRSYPFDVLKIDRSFICDITVDASDRELISAAIAMAHALNLKVVAEGVETKDQLDFLKSLNCDVAQGYLFSKPLSAQDMDTFIIKNQKSS